MQHGDAENGFNNKYSARTSKIKRRYVRSNVSKQLTTLNKTRGAHSNSFLSIALKKDIFNQVITNEEPKGEVNHVNKEGHANEKIYARRSVAHQGNCPVDLS